MVYRSVFVSFAVSLACLGCGSEVASPEPGPWFLRFDDAVQGECTPGSSAEQCEAASCLFMTFGTNSRNTLDILLENRCERDLYMRFDRDEVENAGAISSHPGGAGFGSMDVAGQEVFVFGGWFWREDDPDPEASRIIEVILAAGAKTFMFDLPTLCSEEASTCQSWEDDPEGSACDITNRLERGERVDVELELPIPSFERGQFVRYEGCSRACAEVSCAQKPGFMTFDRPAAYVPDDLNLSRCASRASREE